MLYVKPSQEWIDHVLAEDIITEKGKLLLSKEHVLTNDDLQLLAEWNIEYMVVKDVKNHFEPVINELYNSCMVTIQNIFTSATNNEKIEKETVFKDFDGLIDKMFKTPYLFIQLRTVREINNYTFQHSLNVGALSALLAKLYGLSEEEIIRIGHAGFLHDIGKALIPESILNKTGELTDDEYQIMKRYPLLGHQILEKIGIDDKEILAAVLMHHERLNGTGYPMKKKGDQISIAAQIVAIADVYDAISSEKEYRQSFSPFHAYMELKNLAFQGELNPEIVVKFLEYISKLIEGKKVLLNDGLIGKVIFSTPYEPNRPLVEVDGRFIDLRKERDLYIKELLTEH